jgi:hypothetical protein
MRNREIMRRSGMSLRAADHSIVPLSVHHKPLLARRSEHILAKEATMDSEACDFEIQNRWTVQRSAPGRFTALVERRRYQRGAARCCLRGVARRKEIHRRNSNARCRRRARAPACNRKTFACRAREGLIRLRCHRETTSVCCHNDYEDRSS